MIDSGLLNGIFDTVIRHGGSFEVLRFTIGRTNAEPSLLSMRVSADGDGVLRELVEELVPLGCNVLSGQDVAVHPADLDGCAPPDFYSTTNHETHVRIRGQWITVDHQRMDAAIVVADDRAMCRSCATCGSATRSSAASRASGSCRRFQDRDWLGFAFMTNEISSERRVEAAVGRVAEMMRAVRANGGKIAMVVGPVAVHTGGAPYLAQLIRGGYVEVLLSGNALAVHDVEFALFGTSPRRGPRNRPGDRRGPPSPHARDQSRSRAGGLRQAVDQGVLRTGICTNDPTPRPLRAGRSIRDDGPLPDTMMNLIEAQDQYAAPLDDVTLVLMLATMLHGIGVGNMLPSWVRMVCVDINPAVVTKLADRGSSQTVGIVTDVGLFLHHFAEHLARPTPGRYRSRNALVLRQAQDE